MIFTRLDVFFAILSVVAAAGKDGPDGFDEAVADSYEAVPA